MLMNKVEFCLKVVVLLIRPGTYWVMCYLIQFFTSSSSSWTDSTESLVNERVSHILQSSSIDWASPSDCLVSYQGYLLGGWGVLLLFRDAVYSSAQVNWAIHKADCNFFLTGLIMCVHLLESIGEHCLWLCFYFSSCSLHTLLILCGLWDGR